MKIGPRCRRGGEAPASFANALFPLCRVFCEVFLFRDGGGEGDETGRDGKSVIRCRSHSRRWIDRLRCGVSLSFVCTLELAHSRSRDIPVRSDRFCGGKGGGRGL
jgi:hypothetical protein